MLWAFNEVKLCISLLVLLFFSLLDSSIILLIKFVELSIYLNSVLNIFELFKYSLLSVNATTVYSALDKTPALVLPLLYVLDCDLTSAKTLKSILFKLQKTILSSDFVILYLTFIKLDTQAHCKFFNYPLKLIRVSIFCKK